MEDAIYGFPGRPARLLLNFNENFGNFGTCLAKEFKAVIFP